MIGRRDKDRIQIEDLHTQVAQVVQLVNDALQVSAVEVSYIHGLGQAVPFVHGVHMAVDIAVFIRFHVVGGISVAEAVDKDLVHDGAFGPVRCGKTGENPERVVSRPRR